MNPLPHPPIPKPSRPLAQNRRRGNRHRLHIPAKLIPDRGSDAPIEVTIIEMSVGGVGIRSKTSLPLESIFHLSSFDTLITPGMRIRIVSQQPAPHGEFNVGAQTV